MDAERSWKLSSFIYGDYLITIDIRTEEQLKLEDVSQGIGFMDILSE